MDIGSLVRQMREDGSLNRIANNRVAQFGTQARRYIGAELLPERLVEQNQYTEESVSYRTVVANDGTRYSPTQKKGGALVGSVDVKLAESDIASELTSREYDALLGLLGRNASLEAVAQLTRFLDTTVTRALVERLEAQRWQAIVAAKVELRGDNGYEEDVNYSNPTNHRAAAAAAWSNDATDPFEDIHAMADLLSGKGFTVGRIITSRTVLSKLAGNANVKTRVGVAVVSPSGQIMSAAGRATAARINDVLQEDGLPPIELYDLQYRTATGTTRFLPADAFVMVGLTGRDETLDLGDQVEILPDTLGYAGIGRAAGQASPGRVARAEVFENKPPRVEAEGWHTALPVITEPEAVAVITGIS